MSIYDDTKKSYYQILKSKLNEGNGGFSSQLVRNGKYSCYSGNRSKGHQNALYAFEKFVKSQNTILDNTKGNIIPIDESVFENFPQGRPPTCVKQCTTGSWDRGSNPCSWTRSWYWSEKQSDYNRIKSEIDKKLKVLLDEENSIIEELRVKREYFELKNAYESYLETDEIVDTADTVDTVDIVDTVDTVDTKIPLGLGGLAIAGIIAYLVLKK
jgi:hypothetical protein